MEAPERHLGHRHRTGVTSIEVASTSGTDAALTRSRGGGWADKDTAPANNTVLGRSAARGVRALRPRPARGPAPADKSFLPSHR